MALIDELASLGATADTEPKGKVWPDGWQPRSEIDTLSGGFIVTEPYEPGTDVDTAALFDLHGLDPAKWVVTRARSSRWQQKARGQEPVWLEASRLELEPRSVVTALVTDTDEVVSRIAKWRPRSPKETVDRSFWSPVGDTQLGKVEGGGTSAAVDRFLHHLDAMTARQKRLKAGTVWLPWLGDCIEGVVSQGGKVQGRIDLPITEQIRVYRRLVMAQIKAFTPLTDELVVVAIPGNHDEPSRDLFTVGTDSWALDAVSAVADGIAENPELQDKCRFLYPTRDELTVTVDDQGVRVAMAHGHQFPNRTAYWEDWWDGQIRARLLPGDADLLLAAHRHHLRISDFAGGRLFIQIPSLDGGSQYFDDRRGGNNPSRLISFTLEDGRVRHLDPIL